MEKKELFKRVYKNYHTMFYLDHVEIKTNGYNMGNHPKFKKGIFEQSTNSSDYTEEIFLENYNNLFCRNYVNLYFVIDMLR